MCDRIVVRCANVRQSPLYLTSKRTYSRGRHPKKNNTSQNIAALVKASLIPSYEHQIARVVSDCPCD